MAKEVKSLTPKQRAFYKNIALGMTRTEAAKKAGYKQPRASAADNIRTHTQAFREAFADQDYLISDVVEDLIKGKEAMRTISAVKGNEANGATCDFIDVPDWNARHKFIDTIIKVQGFYPTEKHEVSGPGGGPVEVKFT